MTLALVGSVLLSLMNDGTAELMVGIESLWVPKTPLGGMGGARTNGGNHVSLALFTSITTLHPRLMIQEMLYCFTHAQNASPSDLKMRGCRQRWGALGNSQHGKCVLAASIQITGRLKCDL